MFLGSALYLCLFRRALGRELDEGIVLQGAQRILLGQVPYRDFFSFMAPGSVYAYALLFRCFGATLLVARTALAAMGGCFSLFTYVVARRVCARWSALLAAGLVTLTCLPWRFIVVHNWDSTLCACAAIYAALRWMEAKTDTPRRGWAAAAGFAAALTIACEQSKGLGLCAGLALGCVLVLRLEPLRRRSALPAFLAGLALPAAAAFAWFASRHALPQLGRDLLWPLRHYSAVNRVPYGSADWGDAAQVGMFHSGPWPMRLLFLAAATPDFLLPALPLAGLALGGAWLHRVWPRRAGPPAPPPRTPYYLLLTSVMAGLWVSILAVRQNIVHFVYLAPVFYLVLAWLFDGADWPGTLVRAARPALIAGIAAGFCVAGLGFLFRARSGAPLDTRRGAVVAALPDAALAFIDVHSAPGAPLLVYPYAPMLNFLTATVSPLPWDFFQPGMNTPEQAAEAIQALQAAPPPAAVFDPGFDQMVFRIWPATPPAAILRDPLADYIFAHYRFCRPLSAGQDQPVFYLVRRNLPCP